ncbi:hypothetical protein X773_13095 [Mesorhizobium sp. LSJC285A00]|uniref:SIR2 family protein n=1 Tax=Mesorhizobium sp. LSJC285A00 TaxID=1287338 RepID=UPI0003CE922C|nr:SIR2 family protein [Mesorhizobium sp. LSJC285A00]ESW82162.1 hypothetical protein X773_13095 [Mesorhizobium sp. LSJC285A00]
MAFWDDRVASPANIRLYVRGEGWRAAGDQKNDKGEVTQRGSARAIEEALTGMLNASHLVILTGAGSSFAARNKGQDAKQAPSMKALWDAVMSAAKQAAIDAIAQKIPSAAQVVKDKNIEKFLTHCKMYVELFGKEQAKDVAAFIAIAEATISECVDFVGEDTNLDAHKSIIRKIARRGIRKPRTRLFTTNYDLAFESAAQALRFTIIDGFSHGMPQVYDRGNFAYDIVRRDGDHDGPDYIENVFHLHKLHGSIDWRRRGSELIRSRDKEDGQAALIYPRDSKYQEAFDTPFLDMMAGLQNALRAPDTALIVSGFGFNDDHITKPIMAAVEANMTLRIAVCDIAYLDGAALDKGEHTLPIDAPQNPRASFAFGQLKRLVDIGDQRVTLMNGRFDDLAHALPDLVAQTERERHAERVRVLNEPSEANA